MIIEAKQHILTAVAAVVIASGAAAEPIAGIQASVRVVSRQVALKQPVWVTFSVENISNEPVTLTVPGTEPDMPSPEMGLPLSHIFSGGGGESSGVTVSTEAGRSWSEPLGYHHAARAPILLLAPSSTVGRTVDLREFFPSLLGAGTYRVTWNPYGGQAAPAVANITIAPRKQVEMTTDEGKMTIQLFYDEAPLSVENFVELAKSGFYTGLTFHRIEPGYLVQGGCPRGDGSGIRLDGKRIPSEPNPQPHRKGSVSMALLGDDHDSASSQFFISNTRMKEWDGKYTVFGELVGDDSMATLDRIMQLPADDQGRPKKPVYMRTVRVVDAPAANTLGN